MLPKPRGLESISFLQLNHSTGDCDIARPIAMTFWENLPDISGTKMGQDLKIDSGKVVHPRQLRDCLIPGSTRRAGRHTQLF